MAEQSKRKFLSFERQLEVVKRVKTGVPKEIIMRDFQISKSSYYKILAREEEVVARVHSFEFKNKKSLRTSDNSLLEMALMKWFDQQRDMGVPIRGSDLRKKAIVLNKMLNGPGTFRASYGWLGRFKNRHGIRQVHMKGEKLPEDSNAAEEFLVKLKAEIREPLSDEEIVRFVLSGSRPNEDHECPTEIIDCIASFDGENCGLEDSDPLRIVTAKEAHEGLMNYKKWLESQIGYEKSAFDCIETLENIVLANQSST